MLHLKGPALPDYDHDTLSTEEQEDFLTSLLNSQLALANAVCSESHFSAVLQKRLVVLQRVFHAITNKYHDRDKLRQQQPMPDTGSVATDNKPSLTDKTRSGTDALVG